MLVPSTPIDQPSEPSPPRSTSRREPPRYSREQTHPGAGNEEVGYLLIAGTPLSLFTAITGGSRLEIFATSLENIFQK